MKRIKKAFTVTTAGNLIYQMYLHKNLFLKLRNTIIYEEKVTAYKNVSYNVKVLVQIQYSTSLQNLSI